MPRESGRPNKSIAVTSKHELQPATRDVVEGVGEKARVLRVADEVEVELGARRELERERVAAEVGGMRLA